MKSIVVGQDVDQTLDHIGHQVDTDQVVKAKYSGFRDTHRATKERIGFQRLETQIERRV